MSVCSKIFKYGWRPQSFPTVGEMTKILFENKLVTGFHPSKSRSFGWESSWCFFCQSLPVTDFSKMICRSFFGIWIGHNCRLGRSLTDESLLKVMFRSSQPVPAYPFLKNHRTWSIQVATWFTRWACQHLVIPEVPRLFRCDHIQTQTKPP